MSVMVWLTVGTAVGVASPFIIWRIHTERQRRGNGHNKSRASTGKDAGAQPQPSYAAVVITPGLCACNAVQAFANRKILEKNAPVLPVPSCTEARCECRFRRLDDRRNDDDRRSIFATVGNARSILLSLERRVKKSRRRGKKTVRPRAYFNDHSH